MATPTKRKKLPTPTRWTIVQHSGAGYADKPGFDQGLETRMVTTKVEQDKVLRARGLLFDRYGDAEDYADEENFPDGAGLYPQAPGTFADETIDGLRIYRPMGSAKCEVPGCARQLGHEGPHQAVAR